MSIGAVSGSYANTSAQSLQRMPEAAEVKKAGPDNDGDADDGAVKAVSSAPAPTVNMNGQKIGQLINVTA